VPRSLFAFPHRKCEISRPCQVLMAGLQLIGGQTNAN